MDTMPEPAFNGILASAGDGVLPRAWNIYRGAIMDGQELALTAGRAIVIYVFLLVTVRLLGKRAVGNFTAFDLIVALMLGEVVDEPIFGDVPLVQGLLAIAAVAAAHFLNSLLSYLSPAIDRLTGGQPTPMINDGKMRRDGMARERVSEAELRALLREESIEELSDVQQALLEINGRLSVIKKPEARPLEKGDLAPSQPDGPQPNAPGGSS
jgi:uncharacterized membrane protein YcaP (DUF421 family)